MEIWKTLRVSYIPTPPAMTTDKCPTRRYTNTPLGTKDEVILLFETSDLGKARAFVSSQPKLP